MQYSCFHLFCLSRGTLRCFKSTCLFVYSHIKVENMLRKKNIFPVMMSLSVIYVKILHVVTSCQKKNLVDLLLCILVSGIGIRHLWFMYRYTELCFREHSCLCPVLLTWTDCSNELLWSPFVRCPYLSLYFFFTFPQTWRSQFQLNLVQQSLDNVGQRKDLNFLLQNQGAS